MNNPKAEFFKEFNKAFMTGNIEFILESVTDDVTWTMVGQDTIEGKEDLKEALSNMGDSSHFELEIHHTITHGLEASVDGTIKVKHAGSDEVKTYGFCDVYKLNKHKEGKIKELTSYVVKK
ncbi:nuclear transport factor 2 family protein [Halalkalibacillus halophilus]|uniref:nuclear transport factor 2 family protein n=1 Tax=Halalkalibacillus halophilus TaxID=392827 RepID=UPI000423BD7E|nr:nuclear transport factor 2 family protein [Halalkalibacillus halophilus]